MEEGEYVAIIKSYSEEEVEYNLSPVITDLRINTITESDFI
jgi:hypothetical protein